MRGPIDFIIVGFKGDKFDGSILDALTDALDKGVIDLIALSVIVKDAEGTITTLNLADIGDEYLVKFASKYTANRPFDDEDTAEVSDLLNDNTAAGVLVIEHLWAKPLKEALLAAGGELIADGRIHPEAAKELN